MLLHKLQHAFTFKFCVQDGIGVHTFEGWQHKLGKFRLQALVRAATYVCSGSTGFSGLQPPPFCSNLCKTSVVIHAQDGSHGLCSVSEKDGAPRRRLRVTHGCDKKGLGPENRDPDLQKHSYVSLFAGICTYSYTSTT